MPGYCPNNDKINEVNFTENVNHLETFDLVIFLILVTLIFIN